MKILLLSDSNSAHTIKWATSVSERDIEILIFSIPMNLTGVYKNYKNIGIESAVVRENKQFKNESHPAKITYLASLFKIRKIIKEFKPDILHAHYATSYGLLGALTGFHPFIVSVWGTDVISFPNASFLHKKLLEFNLKKADKILATSRYLAQETKKYTSKNIEITPFGIDTMQFTPAEKKSSLKEIYQDRIVIGCVKKLEETYGLEYLIKAFKIVSETNKDKQQLKLLLVGEGSKLNKFKNLAKDLNIYNDVIFAGKIPFEKIPDYHNIMDIEVYVSVYESFGVAVLEASACGKPVVVSNLGGLPEVAVNNRTGIFVESCNVEQTAEAINKFIADPQLSVEMGREGRKFVRENYEWSGCVDKLVGIYKSLV